MTEKPWTKQTLAEMRAFAAAQDPPIELEGLTRKADVHAQITRALMLREAAAQPEPFGGDRGCRSIEMGEDEMRERAMYGGDSGGDSDLNCAVCGVLHTCHRCNGLRGTDQRAHDEPLCEDCAALVMRPEFVSQRTDGLDVDAAMDAWRKGEAPDDAHRDILEDRREVSTSLVRMPSPGRWAQMEQMAVRLQASTLVRNPRPEDVLVLLLAAHDLGISSTMALQQIHVIDGKPSLSAQLMVALVRNAGFSILPVEMSSTRAIAKGKRGDEEATFEFTLDEAIAAGLATKDNWVHYPKAMLWARAVSGLCRVLFPDVLSGLAYTPEELGATVDAEGNVIDADSWETPPTPPAVDVSDVRLHPDCTKVEPAGQYTHDGTGTCCLAVIRARTNALPDEVKQVFREEWADARGSDGLPPFAQLQQKHRPQVATMLDEAEAVAAQPTTHAPQPPVEQVVDSPLLNGESEPDLSAMLAAELGATVVEDAQIVTDDGRVIDTETGEVPDPNARDLALAARAREIARDAAAQDRPAAACRVCGNTRKPLDSAGYCAECEPF